MARETQSINPLEARVQAIIPQIPEALARGGFPDARVAVMLAHPDGRRIGTPQREKELIYLASKGKIGWLIGAWAYATKQRYTPDLEISIGDAEQKKDLNDEVAKLTNKKERFKGETITLQEITELTLGPSANEPLGILKQWLGHELQNNADEPIKDPAEYIQDKVNTLLKGSLGDDHKVQWTVTGSPQAERNGLWNCGTIEEVMTLFQMLANGDPRLGVSSKAITIMQTEMKQGINPSFELTGKLRKTPSANEENFGKSGDCSVTIGEHPALSATYDPPVEQNTMTYVSSVDRVQTPEGPVDIIYSVAAPYDDPTHPEEADDDVHNLRREQIGNIVTDKLVQIVG